jgi:putative SOS response-associated peptidase YedK
VCGRYSVTRFSRFAQHLPEIDWDALGLEENPAACPTQMLPIVLEEDGRPQIALAQWSFIPPWSDTRRPKIATFNAKSEGLSESKLWSVPFSKPKPGQRGRCLVPADSFFEWQKVGAAKQPYRIYRRDGAQLMFAGLYGEWFDREAGRPLLSFTILTCAPNELMAPIHHRMPVILSGDALRTWLSSDAPSADCLAVCCPCDSDQFEAVPVSPSETRVA